MTFGRYITMAIISTGNPRHREATNDTKPVKGGVAIQTPGVKSVVPGLDHLELRGSAKSLAQTGAPRLLSATLRIVTLKGLL